MKKYPILFLVIVLLWGCKKETEEVKEVITYDEPIKVGLVLTDPDILEKVYDDNYLYPEGYSYRENSKNTAVYYENTISIRTRETAWIELHTNDKKQARDWSERSSKLSSQYRALIGERETEKFFEFERRDPNNSEFKFLSRVHKTSYFVPTFDRMSQGNANNVNRVEIGLFNQKPINLESTKLFVEYLGVNRAVLYGSKILETKVVELPNWFQYNLKSTHLLMGDMGMSDVIEVWNSDYFVHKRTGDVYAVSTKIKELTGKKR